MKFAALVSLLGVVKGQTACNAHQLGFIQVCTGGDDSACATCPIAMVNTQLAGCEVSDVPQVAAAGGNVCPTSQTVIHGSCQAVDANGASTVVNLLADGSNAAAATVCDHHGTSGKCARNAANDANFCTLTTVDCPTELLEFQTSCTADCAACVLAASDETLGGCLVSTVSQASGTTYCTTGGCTGFDCSSHANALDAAPGAVVCAAAICTDTECCTAAPVTARTCADINADGTANDAWDCSSHANAINAAPAGVTCAGEPCLDNECCTVVPAPGTPPAADASGAALAAPAAGLLLLAALLQ